jgi:hypothetical protein
LPGERDDEEAHSRGAAAWRRADARAGWIGHAIGWYTENEGAGFIAAIVGAFIILGIYRLIMRGRA